MPSLTPSPLSSLSSLSVPPCSPPRARYAQGAVPRPLGAARPLGRNWGHPAAPVPAGARWGDPSGDARPPRDERAGEPAQAARGRRSGRRRWGRCWGQGGERCQQGQFICWRRCSWGGGVFFGRAVVGRGDRIGGAGGGSSSSSDDGRIAAGGGGGCDGLLILNRTTDEGGARRSGPRKNPNPGGATSGGGHSTRSSAAERRRRRHITTPRRIML